MDAFVTKDGTTVVLKLQDELSKIVYIADCNRGRAEEIRNAYLKDLQEALHNLGLHEVSGYVVINESKGTGIEVVVSFETAAQLNSHLIDILDAIRSVKLKVQNPGAKEILTLYGYTVYTSITV